MLRQVLDKTFNTFNIVMLMCAKSVRVLLAIILIIIY